MHPGISQDTVDAGVRMCVYCAPAELIVGAARTAVAAAGQTRTPLAASRQQLMSQRWDWEPCKTMPWPMWAKYVLLAIQSDMNQYIP